MSYLLGGERDGGVGIGGTEINLSQLLSKTLFFLYYNLAGLFSRGCLTLKLVDSAKLHNTDLHKRTQNVPVFSQFFKARTASKEQADQTGKACSSPENCC